MKIKSKINAFTMGEMVVVLILTSIIVGMAFSVLTLVQRHLQSIQSNFSNNAELNKLEQILCLDFNRYSDIRFNAREELLLFKSTLDSVEYRFYDNYIIKEQDTFNISIINKTFYFDGEPLRDNASLDALKIETSKVFQNQILFVYRTNDAKVFME